MQTVCNLCVCGQKTAAYLNGLGAVTKISVPQPSVNDNIRPEPNPERVYSACGTSKHTLDEAPMRNPMLIKAPRSAVFPFLLTTVLLVAAHAQTFTVIHAFTGQGDGGAPYAGVTLDQAGNVYGAAWIGGSHDMGTVYQLKRAGSGYTLNTLYTFANGPGGTYPKGGVTFGRGGALYGTASQGGYDGCGVHGYIGCGIVFSLRPQSTFCNSALCAWIETTTYAFQGVTTPDGDNPLYGEVAFDAAGNIYGTTQNDGAYGYGTAYELTRSGDTWTETVLHSFGAPGDGQYPDHNVVLDSAGNVYGTTYSGGASGAGTVFQLVPSGSGWTENILASFDGQDDIGGFIQSA